MLIGLHEYIGKLSSNKGLSICNFCEWKNKIFSVIDDKISNLKTDIIPMKVNPTLKNCD